MKKNIIDVVNTVLDEYLCGEIIQMGAEDPEYMKMTENMGKAIKRFGTIEGIIDADRPCALTEQECETLIEYLHMGNCRDSRELQYAYLLGYRDSIVLQRKYSFVKDFFQEEKA